MMIPSQGKQPKNKKKKEQHHDSTSPPFSSNYFTSCFQFLVIIKIKITINIFIPYIYIKKKDSSNIQQVTGDVAQNFHRSIFLEVKIKRRRLLLFMVVVAVTLHGVQRRRFGPSSGARHFGRRLHANQRQVEPFKEGVLFDVSGAALRAEPARRILVQQAGYQIPRVQFKIARWCGRGERQWFLYDVPQRSLFRWTRIRRATVDELVDKYSKRPPVHGVPVRPARSDLRRDVLVGPNKGTGPSRNRFGNKKPIRFNSSNLARPV